MTWNTIYCKISFSSTISHRKERNKGHRLITMPLLVLLTSAPKIKGHQFCLVSGHKKLSYLIWLMFLWITINTRVYFISLWFRNLPSRWSLTWRISKNMSLVPFAWILTPSLRPWFVFIPCLNCLEEHALRTGRQGQFLCPDCQAQVNIPEGNCFDNLPTGFLQNSLLSLLAVRQSRDGSQIGCGNCNKKSAEISYCFACEKRDNQVFLPWMPDLCLSSLCKHWSQAS